MNRDRILAFAQLLRLPNVFTAFADIALAAAVGAGVLGTVPGSYWIAAAWLALASGCLYLGGMVWNDFFDRAEDAKLRSFRPIPSGRISARTAAVLGVLLFALGLAFAALAGLPGQNAWRQQPLVHGAAIAIAVLAYDGGLKRTPIGPVAMGTCRFLNVLLGLSIVPEELLAGGIRLHLAGVVGLYITGVTWFARTEEGRSDRRQLIAAAAVIALALILALILRARSYPTSGLFLFLFPYLLVGFGFVMGRPIARAIRSPGPREVQLAIKRCVLGLVALDAVLATAFVGMAGFAILLLLPPAIVIGKWVYST